MWMLLAVESAPVECEYTYGSKGDWWQSDSAGWVMKHQDTSFHSLSEQHNTQSNYSLTTRRETSLKESLKSNSDGRRTPEATVLHIHHKCHVKYFPLYFRILQSVLMIHRMYTCEVTFAIICNTNRSTYSAFVLIDGYMKVAKFWVTPCTGFQQQESNTPSSCSRSHM